MDEAIHSFEISLLKTDVFDSIQKYSYEIHSHDNGNVP